MGHFSISRYCGGALLATVLWVPINLLAQTVTVPDLPVEQIVKRMMEANAQRALELQKYTGRRVYKFDYHGFPANKTAELVVKASYVASGIKQFEIVSESGSKAILDRVLKKLLENERNVSFPGNQASAAVSDQNYRFSLLGMVAGLYGPCYRMNVEPKRDSKYLYRGEICINASDFAVESIDADLAKNPAFWIIRKTHIKHHYLKIGEFWVPGSNHSQSKITLGGTATLNVEYLDYVVQPGEPAPATTVINP
jgi:hypothetical protein